MYICIVVALVLLAGLMSGLTLGLMSMDVLDMEVTSCLRLHIASWLHLGSFLGCSM